MNFKASSLPELEVFNPGCPLRQTTGELLRKATAPPAVIGLRWSEHSRRLQPMDLTCARGKTACLDRGDHFSPLLEQAASVLYKPGVSQLANTFASGNTEHLERDSVLLTEALLLISFCWSRCLPRKLFFNTYFKSHFWLTFGGQHQHLEE